MPSAKLKAAPDDLGRLFCVRASVSYDFPSKLPWETFAEDGSRRATFPIAAVLASTCGQPGQNSRHWKTLLLGLVLVSFSASFSPSLRLRFRFWSCLWSCLRKGFSESAARVRLNPGITLKCSDELTNWSAFRRDSRTQQDMPGWVREQKVSARTNLQIN